MFLSFIECLKRNRSVLVQELLSNNSLFVGQLYEDKSFTLHALDLLKSSAANNCLTLLTN